MKIIAASALLTGATAVFCLNFLPASWASTAVAGSPVSGPAAPVAPQALSDARLSGGGTLQFFGLDIYEARLWVRPGFNPQNYGAQSFALELRYARSFTSDAIASRSIDEMRRQRPIGDAQAAQWRAALGQAFPAVKPGDVLIGVHAPTGTARFWHNGTQTGHMVDTEFAHLFFGIWLSPKTSEPALRSALLGQP